jgi:hypothetical protein
MALDLQPRSAQLVLQVGENFSVPTGVDFPAKDALSTGYCQLRNLLAQYIFGLLGCQSGFFFSRLARSRHDGCRVFTRLLKQGCRLLLCP